MKNLELKYHFFLKKAIVSLGLIAFMFTTMIITYSCTKENNVANNNEPQTVPEARGFEKQFIVFDKTGNNSITLRVSTDDATLLADQCAESYDLIINPEIPEETTNDNLAIDIEDSDLTDLKDNIEVKKITVQMDIINISFKDKVNNYALVSRIPSMVDEDDPELVQEGETKAGLCFWYPRTYEYYDVNAWGAKKVKMTFNRTKRTCNNIKYYVCPYGSTSYVCSCYLKNPGDTKTCGPYNWNGITLLYKHYKNQNPTYTFYY